MESDKLKIAFEMGLHSTVGADLVNHCVERHCGAWRGADVFMDYLATGEARASDRGEVVEGIADA